MIRRTLLALALLAAPAVVMAQQPSPMQGQAPAADTSKGKAAATTQTAKGKKGKKGKKAKKPTAPSAAKADTAKKP